MLKPTAHAAHTDAATARDVRLDRALAVLLAGAIVTASMAPWSFRAAVPDVSRWFGWTQVTWHATPAHDLIGNVLAYVPLGFLLVRLCNRRSAKAIPQAVVTAAVLSLACEWCQLLVPGRVSSWLDVAANSTGAALGAMAGQFRSRRPEGFARALSHDALFWLRAAALLIGAGLLARLAPFDLSLAGGYEGNAGVAAFIGLQRLMNVFNPGRPDVASAAAFGAGAMCLTWGISATWRSAWPTAMTAWLVVAGVSVLAELAQLAIASRTPDLADLLLGVLASFTGAIAAAATLIRRDVSRERAAAVLALVISLALLLDAATPLAGAVGRLNAPHIGWIPFASVASRPWAPLFCDITAQMAAYIALAACVTIVWRQAARAQRSGPIGVCMVVASAGQWLEATNSARVGGDATVIFLAAAAAVIVTRCLARSNPRGESFAQKNAPRLVPPTGVLGIE